MVELRKYRRREKRVRNKNYLRFVYQFDGKYIKDKIYYYLTSDMVGIEPSVLDKVIKIMNY
ncbi:MAG: hypothetical protein J5903_04400 [Clostridia bacterium]|nr:hypothetical protein [Clostridia bacterium]